MMLTKIIIILLITVLQLVAKLHKEYQSTKQRSWSIFSSSISYDFF